MTSPEQRDDRPYIETHGKRVYIGDRVVIVKVYKEDETDTPLVNPESLIATFVGEDIAEYEGEVLFGGEPIPRFELLLPDGCTQSVWGFECDWVHTEVYDEASSYIADIKSAPYN